MKQLSSMLSLLFGIMFWGFRVFVTYMSATGKDSGFPIQNFNVEVMLLFLTIVFLICVYKRNLIGGLIYLLVYGAYFGPQLFDAITIVASGEGADIYTYDTIIASTIGIVVALFAFLNILADKNRATHPTDKKTDWFYKNEQYDRKLDDRADKNNYRTL